MDRRNEERINSKAVDDAANNAPLPKTPDEVKLEDQIRRVVRGEVSAEELWSLHREVTLPEELAPTSEVEQDEDTDDVIYWPY